MLGHQIIDKSKLIQLFSNISGTRIVTATIRTEPKLIKPQSNPLNGRLIKLQTIQGPVGFSYENAVNKQRSNEAGPKDIVEYFSALARPWVEYIPGSPLIRHKDNGTIYVPIRPDAKLKCQYLVDGIEVPYEDVEGFLYRQTKDSGKQNTLDKVPYINFKLDNLLQIKGLTKDIIYTIK